MAVQSRINGALGARLHDGVAAAVVSFGGGFVLLCLIALCSSTVRAQASDIKRALSAGRLRPWQCFGGVFGALLVACQGITVASIGVALFTVAVVGGQIACSLVVDRLGIGPAGVSPITATRAVGAALAVVAVAVAARGGVWKPSLVRCSSPLCILKSSGQFLKFRSPGPTPEHLVSWSGRVWRVPVCHECAGEDEDLRLYWPTCALNFTAKKPLKAQVELARSLLSTPGPLSVPRP